MLSNALIGARSFVKLEQRLIEDLCADSQAAEDQSVTWIIVPNNLLALHLHRLLARENEGVMGLRFMPLQDAAREACGPEPARRSLSPAPDGLTELLLEKELKNLSEDSYFKDFSEFPGSVRVISRTIDLLRHALWSPSSLREAAPGPSHRELAELWGRIREFKDGKGLYDAVDLLSIAASGCWASEEPETVIFYGFYDLTSLQKRFFSRLGETADSVRAYLLWDEDDAGEPTPGFAYAGKVVAFLLDLVDVDSVECTGDVDGASDLLRLREESFLPTHNMGGSSDGQMSLFTPFDGSVEILNTPGKTRESQEIVRDILRRLHWRTPPKDIAVLPRTAADTAEELAESLDRAGAEYYMNEGRPIAQTKPGRIVLQALALTEGEARRTDVIQLLSMADVTWPGDLNVTALDRLSRLAGIVKGWDSWADRLNTWATEQEHRADGDEESVSNEQIESDAGLARSAADFIDQFLRRIRGLASHKTWEGLAKDLADFLVDHLSPNDDGRHEVLEAVHNLRDLDIAGIPPSVSWASRLLNWSLNAQYRRGSRYQTKRVSFASLMRSRGTTYDVVVLPQMLEKSFPRQIPATPLLSDSDRAELNATAERLGGGRLPLQRNRPREERYLFRIALGSARRAIVMTFPRIEQDSGRPRIPSRFLEQSCESLLQRPVRTEDILNASLGGLTRRVAPGPVGKAEEALDTWEYDLATHMEADRATAISYTSELSTTFQRAAEMDSARWARTDFGPFDGKISDDKLLSRLADQHGLFRHAVSPTRLETYAQCPFRYFARYLLGIEEAEEPTEEPEIPPMERGSLLHKLYCELYRRELRGVNLAELNEEHISRILSTAEELLDELGEDHARARPASWEAARYKALNQLRQALATEQAENEGARPEAFEYEFGETHGNALVLGQEPEHSVRVRGRIDRIDGLSGDGIQVIDYKTGSSRCYKKDSFEGGTQLQLPLYLLAAAGDRDVSSGQARYFFVTEPSFTSEFDMDVLSERREDLEHMVRLILRGVRSGHFFLLPRDVAGGRGRSCRDFCSFRAMCGATRDKLAEIKYEAGTDPDLRNLMELWDIE